MSSLNSSYNESPRVSRAAADIQKAVPNAKVEALQLDLTSFECAPLLERPAALC